MTPIDQAERLRNMDFSVQNSPQRVLAVTSGKGGVGKTNFSVNLSIALAQLGFPPLILDADLGMANVDLLLGQTPRYTLQHALNRQVSLGEVMMQGPEGIRIIPGVSGVASLTQLRSDQTDWLLTQLDDFSKTHPTPFVLLDTAAGLSEGVLQFVLAADEVILITTPEPTAMMDAYAMIKTVIRQRPNALIRLVVNMARTAKDADKVVETLQTITRKFLNAEIDPLGYIPKDSGVGQSVRRQVPFLLDLPRTAASLQIRHIARQLVEKRGEKRFSGIRRFFERAFLGGRLAVG